MAITGRNAAIVQTGRLRLTGRLAWIAWGFLHLTYLPGALNRMTTGLKYLWWHLSHETPTASSSNPNHHPTTPPRPRHGTPGSTRTTSRPATCQPQRRA